MACLIALMSLFAPRLAIILVVIFSDYIGRAYDSFLWPFLGFFFMPLTTLAFAWSTNTYGGLEGPGIVVFVLAVLFDLGLVGNAERSRRSKPSKC